MVLEDNRRKPIACLSVRIQERAMTVSQFVYFIL